MTEFTIYGTKEQTKKALKLGAPIQTGPYFHIVKYETQNFFVKNDTSYHFPTTEEMIGWLEEQDGIKEITISKTGMWIWGKKHTLIKCGLRYSSRQEATLAAIDAALDYLINNKK